MVFSKLPVVQLDRFLLRTRVGVMSFQSPSLFLFILVYQYFDRLPSQLGRHANSIKPSNWESFFFLPVFLMSCLINGHSSLFKVNAKQKLVVSFDLKNVGTGIISRHVFSSSDRLGVYFLAPSSFGLGLVQLF